MTRLLLPLIALAAVAPVRAQDPLPKKDEFHVYLLMGQSNMAGRGKIPEKYRKPHSRVMMLDKQNLWRPATAPLHFDKPKIAGLGSGDAFGRTLADADPNVTIGLVPCAVGGTPLKRWLPDGDLYKNAVKRAKIAAKSGTLKGMIWHQGEADSRNAETAKSYGERLSGMIATLRKDLDAPNLPVVVGELGRFLNKKRSPHFTTVNEQLNALPKSTPNSACASSEGLKAKADGVHFNASSLETFGRRYAAKMRILQLAKRKNRR